MQFEAAQMHLPGVHGLPRHARDPRAGGVDAGPLRDGLGGPLGRRVPPTRSRRWPMSCWPRDAERSLEVALGAADGGHRRPGASRAGSPATCSASVSGRAGIPASRRWPGSTARTSGSSTGSRRPPRSRRCRPRWRSASHPAPRTGAALLALIAFRLGERYDQALLMLDAALEQARREGHAARQGIIHAERAAVALGQGVAARRRGRGRDRTAAGRGAAPRVPAAARGRDHRARRTRRAGRGSRARRAAAPGSSSPSRVRICTSILAARARLRIAEGDVPAALADLQRCGRDAEALGVQGPSHWMSLAAPALAAAR